MNNMISSTGGCQNSTSYPYLTYCCCYGDGCNSAPGTYVYNWQKIAVGLFTAMISLAFAKFITIIS